MKHLSIFAFLISTSFLAGCGTSDNSPMDDFKRDKPFSKEGGVLLPNGDFAKYSVASDSSTAEAQIEISSRGQCFRVAGAIPVKLIDGEDANGQYWQSEDLKVQIKPKQRGQPKYNDRFVHFVVDRNDKSRVTCSEAPKDSIPENELRSKMQTTFFSNFPLTDRQRQMAGLILPRGSNSFMLFFKNHKIGLVFDSVSNELIGVDVPKQILETDFIFTVNRELLKTDLIPENELFPLLITNDDIETHRRTVEIAKAMGTAVENLKDDSPQSRDFVISSVWAQFFRK